MTDLPSRREFKVLKALCLDTVEDRGQWPGVGAGTEAALVQKDGSSLPHARRMTP